MSQPGGMAGPASAAALVAALAPQQAPVAPKSKTGLIIGITVAILVVGVLVVVLVLTLGKKEPKECSPNCADGCDDDGKCICPECLHGGKCDTATGMCTNCGGAAGGWGGRDCSEETPKCDPACTSGQKCDNGTCVNNLPCNKVCQNGGKCDPNTGKCKCVNGWSGEECTNPPPDRYWIKCTTWNDANHKKHDDWCQNDIGPGYTHVVGEGTGEGCALGSGKGKCRYTG